MRSTILLATLASTLTLATAIPAEAAPGDPGLDPVECLMGPHIPETPLYYILFRCTTGGHIDEPIEKSTGCRFVFMGFFCPEDSPVRQASDLAWDTLIDDHGYPESCALRLDGNPWTCQFNDIIDWITNLSVCVDVRCYI